MQRIRQAVKGVGQGIKNVGNLLGTSSKTNGPTTPPPPATTIPGPEIFLKIKTINKKPGDESYYVKKVKDSNTCTVGTPGEKIYKVQDDKVEIVNKCELTNIDIGKKMIAIFGPLKLDEIFGYDKSPHLKPSSINPTDMVQPYGFSNLKGIPINDTATGSRDGLDTVIEETTIDALLANDTFKEYLELADIDTSKKAELVLKMKEIMKALIEEAGKKPLDADTLSDLILLKLEKDKLLTAINNMNSKTKLEISDIDNIKNNPDIKRLIDADTNLSLDSGDPKYNATVELLNKSVKQIIPIISGQLMNDRMSHLKIVTKFQNDITNKKNITTLDNPQTEDLLSQKEIKDILTKYSFNVDKDASTGEYDSNLKNILVMGINSIIDSHTGSSTPLPTTTSSFLSYFGLGGRGKKTRRRHRQRATTTRK